MIIPFFREERGRCGSRGEKEQRRTFGSCLKKLGRSHPPTSAAALCTFLMEIGGGSGRRELGEHV